jgi:8-amino-7-oxononanoate synthase
MSCDPLSWLEEELQHLEKRDLLRGVMERSSPQQAQVTFATQGKLVNFGSNDYLGFANHPLLLQVTQRAIAQHGFGAGASPLVTGRNTCHSLLEQLLAKFEETEAAILFPTGYAANVGTITALVSSPDIIFSDSKNHASIIDGCRLSGAVIEVYPHGNVEYLAEKMAHASNYRRRLIVTDSLFSMDGDLAPLPQLAQLARKTNSMLLVDEAHATGVFGAHGRGLCEALHVEDNFIVRIGTLSKALGSHGGFVTGSQLLIDYLRNKARPYIFSTAFPSANAAAGMAALQLIQAEPIRRHRVLDTAAKLRMRLSSDGWNVGCSQSQIIPIFLGDAALAMRYATVLRQQGFFVPGIRPPSVPLGESLLRISLTSEHTWEQCESLLHSLEKCRSTC